MKNDTYHEDYEGLSKEEREIQEMKDAHDGRWAGWLVVIAGLAAALLVTWGLNHIFSHP